MKLPRRNFLHLAAGAAALPAVSRVAWAQAYPTRPVRLIEGFGAGSAPDVLARLIGQSLSERLGQSFVVENRSGANSNIATDAVARASPDGYTLLLITSANAINATAQRSTSTSSAISCRSRASFACPWSWRSTRRFRPGPLRSSSLMPRPILARSIWRQPQPEV